jgi:MoaA/NifB/PqqE/SkfB family radical SAM enzyme
MIGTAGGLMKEKNTLTNIPTSKTFCPYPWLHVMTQPSGSVSWCCIASDKFKKDDGEFVNLANGDRIEDVWNSNHMKQIRQQMLDGERVEGCDPCYDLGNMGFPTYRENFIDDWLGHNAQAEEVARRIEVSKTNGYVVEEPPLYLDFRLGTMCNLKCRMCQPQNSSQIFKEFTNIEAEDPIAGRFLKENFTWGNFGEYRDWQDDPEFLEQVEKWLPQVTKLYFTGGEPTIIERVYWIMQKCVDLGIAQDIELVFNSNMTNVQGRFISLVEQFKNVLMCISVDAHGKLNEYIRGASHWKQVDKNIRKYCESKVVGRLLFSPVIQVYNILNITDLLDYMEELEIEFGREIYLSLLVCFYPASLDFRVLPDNVREEAIKRLEAWKKRSKSLMSREESVQSMDALIKALKEKRHDDWEKQLRTFKKYTKLLDGKRNESFEESIPDLYRLMNDE